MALLLLLAACGGGAENCARLPGGGRYCLVAGVWPEFSVEQLATITYQGKSQRLIMRIQSGADGLQLAGLTPLGQTLLQVSWRNGILRADFPPAVGDRLDGALFPALLQIATWPAGRVRAGLPDGLTLIEGDGRRIVTDGAQEMLIISWDGTTLPYRSLRFELPAASLLIEASTLDEATAP